MTSFIRTLGRAGLALTFLVGTSTLAFAGPLQNRVEALESELKALKEQIQAGDAKVEAIDARTADLDDLPIFDPTQLKLTSRDGKNSIRVGGGIYLDGVIYDIDQAGTNVSDHGAEFRLIRLFAEGKVAGAFKYKLEVDFDGDDASHTIDFKDVYIAYVGHKGVEVKAGHFKAPQGLEELTSDNFTTFMERALMHQNHAFSPARQVGLQLAHRGEDFGIAAGYFFEGDFVNGDTNTSAEANEGVTGRAWFAPVKEKKKTVHVGVGASFRNNGGNTLHLEAQPANHNAPELVDATISSANWDDYAAVTPEVAVVFGPFSAQAEYAFLDIQGKGGAPDADAQSFYVFGSWFVTGHNRPYKVKKGAFGRIKGDNAVEVAVRYDHLDASDTAFTNGAEISNLTFGVNYYFNPFVRAMLNVTTTDVDANAGPDSDGETVGSRLQVDF